MFRAITACLVFIFPLNAIAAFLFSPIVLPASAISFAHLAGNSFYPKKVFMCSMEKS